MGSESIFAVGLPLSIFGSRFCWLRRGGSGKVKAKICKIIPLTDSMLITRMPLWTLNSPCSTRPADFHIFRREFASKVGIWQCYVPLCVRWGLLISCEEHASSSPGSRTAGSKLYCAGVIIIKVFIKVFGRVVGLEGSGGREI